MRKTLVYFLTLLLTANFSSVSLQAKSQMTIASSPYPFDENSDEVMPAASAYCPGVNNQKDKAVTVTLNGTSSVCYNNTTHSNSWYKFTSNRNVNHLVYTNGAPAGTEVRVWEGSSLKAMKTVPLNGSPIVFKATAYTTYYISIRGASQYAYGGTFDLIIRDYRWPVDKRANAISARFMDWGRCYSDSLRKPSNSTWWRNSSACEVGYYEAIHAAVDITPVNYRVDGDNIYAFYDGKVIKAGKESNGTILVSLYHSSNPVGTGQLQSRYLHLSRVGNYSVNSEVKLGDIIGYMGHTGPATGTHLHFGVQDSNNPSDSSFSFNKSIDPLATFFKQNNPIPYSINNEQNFRNESLKVGNDYYGLSSILSLDSTIIKNWGITKQDIELFINEHPEISLYPITKSELINLSEALEQ